MTGLRIWKGVIPRIPTGPEAEVRASAAPTTGYWFKGDRCLNAAPAAGVPVGWVCTAAGTPGTWKAEANLV
jgi:hypothetical protein